MDQIFIVNQNNEKLEVQVVRYFKISSGNYFLYTLDETDDGGYVKLYATKVSIINGLLTGNNIADDNEWNQIKDLIKVIIKENQTGNVTSVETLPSANLINLKVDDARVFKLSKSLADLLAVKRPVDSVATTAPAANVVPEIPVAQPETVPPVVTPEVAKAEPVVPVATPVEAVIPASPEPALVETIDYQARFEEAKAENEKLRSILVQYKDRIEQIRQLVE